MKRGLAASLALLSLLPACQSPERATSRPTGAEANNNRLPPLMYSDSQATGASVPVRCVGKLIDDKRMGVWKYFWPDGSLALIGEFDDKGKLNGPWVYLNQTHAVQLDVSVGLHCDGSRFGWRDFAFEEWRKAWGDDSLTWLWYRWPELLEWEGPGLYASGNRVRELQAEEARVAVASLLAP